MGCTGLYEIVHIWFEWTGKMLRKAKVQRYEYSWTILMCVNVLRSQALKLELHSKVANYRTYQLQNFAT